MDCVAALQGEMKANFLRHEGYLGAVGAFLSVNPMEQHLQSPPAVTEPRAAGPAGAGDDGGNAASQSREPRQVLGPSKWQGAMVAYRI